MTTPKLDTNQWYQICLDGNSKGQCFVGTWLYTASNTKGATFLSPANSSASDQLWAVFPVTVNSTTVYTLRTRDSGPNGFLATEVVAEEVTEGNTRPSMFRGDIAVNNVFWSFGSWGDGTFFLSNTANGTGWHMNKKDNGIMAMSSNITAPQNGQRYGFAAVANINDGRYSSVNLLGVSSTPASSNTASATTPISLTSVPTSTPTTTSADPNTNPNTNMSPSGLSTGAKAGIGAGVGGIALIALIILGLYFGKKRKQRLQYAMPPELANNTPDTKYEMYHDSSAKYELPLADAVEVPHSAEPAELPGHLPENAKRHP